MKESLVGQPGIESATVRLDERDELRAARGRAAGVLGLASAALLFASFRWAHHWGPLSVAIVAGWALATISAFVISVWSLGTTRASRRFSMLGLTLALVSLLAVALVTVAYAMGADVSDACGGG